MKTDFAKQSFTGLPPWAKGVIAIGLLAGTAYIVRKLMKAPGEIKAGQGNRQEDKSWNQQFDKLNTNPATKATIDKAQMTSYANSLFTAMDGYGTDESGIMRIIDSLKNDADFAGVSAAYGVREVSSGAWNPEPNYKGTLSGALASELSASWVSALNATLAKKGIKYKF